MFELDKDIDFISYYESAFKKKIYRIPFDYNGIKVGLLCVKKNKNLISLPYLSLGAIVYNPKKLDNINYNNIEIRDIISHSDNIYSDKVNFEINLNAYKYPSNIVRKINKSIKNNIIIQSYNYNEINQEVLGDFYRVYSKRMHSIGVPIISKSQLRHRISSKKYQLFIAYYMGKPIGASSLNHINNNYFENEFIASNPKYNSLYTSYGLHNNMINTARENGGKIYSLGRSTRNSSVYDYKKHWKANEINLVWSNTSRIINPKLIDLFHNIYSFIPYRIAIILGQFIHRRMN